MRYLVTCKEETYRYNAYHIAKAFFGDEEVTAKVLPEQRALICVYEKQDDSEDLALVSENNADSVITEISDSEDKNDAERQLYKSLSEYTGKHLPWGILTGIRPTKLASASLKRGESEEAFIEYFMSERLVSDDKAHLAWNIAEREHDILKNVAEYERGHSGEPYKPYSLYIGIPFCPSVCSYCSFSAGTTKQWSEYIDRYIDALIMELEITAQRTGGRTPDTIYIGGGTPTSISPERLERVFEFVNKSFNPLQTMEFTLEAGRPDTITKEHLALARSYGVSRISINPQTMQDDTLERIGRKHTADQTVKAFEMARKLGFTNINMDLIAGLPGEGVSDIKETLKKVFELEPDSLTVHSLAIKRASGIFSQPTPSDIVSEMISTAGEAAIEHGLEPYYLYRQKGIAGNLENIGYAKPGKEGLYNILIMEEVQTIIACGAGASSKLVLDKAVPNPVRGARKMTNIIRTSNPKQVDVYIDRIADFRG